MTLIFMFVCLFFSFSYHRYGQDHGHKSVCGSEHSEISHDLNICFILSLSPVLVLQSSSLVEVWRKLWFDLTYKGQWPLTSDDLTDHNIYICFIEHTCLGLFTPSLSATWFFFFYKIFLVYIQYGTILWREHTLKKQQTNQKKLKQNKLKQTNKQKPSYFQKCMWDKPW